MLSHIVIPVSDFGRSFRFYSGLASWLDWDMRFYDETRPWAVWSDASGARPFLILMPPFAGGQPEPGNGVMAAFVAPSRAAVRSCYAEAVAQGGTDEGAPGLRPQYHPSFYGTYFRDPDRFKICVCCHHPE